MLFTLDNAIESMERESLDVGIVSMLEALDHAMCALHNVVVPFGWVWFDLDSCPFLPLYSFSILTIVSLQSPIAHSQGKSRFLHQQKEV